MTEIITRDNAYRLVSPHGVNVLYLEGGNMYFTRQWWSDIFDMDLEPLPDGITESQLVTFLEKERSRASLRREGKLFYGYYKRHVNGQFAYTIPFRVTATADVLMTYDGSFLHNVKNRYMKNGHTIVLDDPFTHAWKQFWLGRGA